MASSPASPWMWNQICRSCSSPSTTAAGSPARASLRFGCRPWNFGEPFRNAPRRSQCSGYSGFGPHSRYSRAVRACALAWVRWAIASYGHTELDWCDLPTARFGVSEWPRRAKHLVVHANRSASRVEALRSVGLPLSAEQRIERSNDRSVVGRWLIARYQGDGVCSRRGSLKQPSLALAGNQGRGAALTLTIQECVEGRDQAERALRMI